jgi:hypothetical protein
MQLSLPAVNQLGMNAMFTSSLRDAAAGIDLAQDPELEFLSNERRGVGMGCSLLGGTLT